MTDEPCVTDPDASPSQRRRRSNSWVWAGATAVAVVLPITIWLVLAGSTEATPPTPGFVDEASAAGVDHSYEGDFPYFVGGGVAAFDCDDDGRYDLYFAGGSAPAALFRNRSTIGGALRFERQASTVTDLTSVTGAYPLDIESDGILDLMVVRNGAGNVVLRGLGNCEFEQANDRYDVAGGDAWTVGFSATWEGTNRLPTLAFGNYLVPETTDCDSSTLVRPDASGDRYGPSIPLTPGYCTLSVLFSDWSRSGRRDLRMANDRHYYRDGTEQLWRVEPGHAPRLFTDADGWRQLQIWGMGIASQDLTGDGYPEVFITSQADNKLQTLDDTGARPAYHDMALSAGVTAQRPFAGDDVLPSTAWDPEFEDVNNDGLVDLFISKGNVEAEPGYATRDPNNLFIGREDGTFREDADAAGIVNFARARGAAVADLNLDGLLDLVVVNREVNVELWRNVGRGDAQHPKAIGHWLGVRLHQTAPNVDAIGAWVDVRLGERTVVRELTVGGGHAGGTLGWLHFGLGEATSADVRIHWPDGVTGPWTSVAADQFVTIDRDAAAPVPWAPPS